MGEQFKKNKLHSAQERPDSGFVQNIQAQEIQVGGKYHGGSFLNGTLLLGDLG